MNTKAFVAELVGTFLFVFVGVLCIIGGFLGDGGGANLVAIGLAHGITIAVLATAFGTVSGGHFNPAVSLGLLIAGQIKFAAMIGYWIAQIGGATLGAWVGYLLVGPSMPVAAGAGVPALAESMTPMTGMMAECIGAFMLILTVFGTAVRKGAPKMGGLSIGLSLTAMIYAIGPMTGCSINPARFLGPALASGKLTEASSAAEANSPSVWMLVYILGPCIGALIAALIYRFVLEDDAEPVAA